jgi:hypothetical protein
VGNLRFPLTVTYQGCPQSSLISILEENCLATIFALGHVVRKTRDDHAGEPTHAGKRTPVNGYVSPDCIWTGAKSP